jgi:hypothetical protein
MFLVVALHAERLPVTELIPLLREILELMDVVRDGGRHPLAVAATLLAEVSCTAEHTLAPPLMLSIIVWVCVHGCSSVVNILTS